MTERRKLTAEFYRRKDTVHIARELLGKILMTAVDGRLTGGIIVETEAYCGPEDRGSHAYQGRRSSRNEMMYQQGGVVYMYICYGIHDMLNIVTGEEGTSHAVLIRALEPVLGLDTMRERRGVFNDDRRLCRGPGALAKALGLNKNHNGADLMSELIWIEESQLSGDIAASPRIGLGIDGPYRNIPWRFFLTGNPFVSGKKLKA